MRRATFLFMSAVLIVAGSDPADAAAGPNVWAWGSNSWLALYTGTLGLGVSSPEVLLPTQVPDPNPITDMAFGSHHSVLLRSDGTVWASGYGQEGRLGQGPGNFASSNSPLQVVGLSGVIDIAAGSAHSLALKSDGTVWGWGTNHAGENGNGTVGLHSYTPTQVSGLSGIIAISAGGQSSMALASDHTVWTWGSDLAGMIGDGVIRTTGCICSPTPVHLSLSGIDAIDAAGNFDLALTSAGTVWVWGDNQHGQMTGGFGAATCYFGTPCRRTPGLIPLSKLSQVKAVTGGSYFGVALKQNGTVWAWGDNRKGQLGVAPTVTDLIIDPAQITSLTGVTSISAGAEHVLAVGSSGDVKAWGGNSRGQLGVGSTISSHQPATSSGITGMNAVSAGLESSFAGQLVPLAPTGLTASPGISPIQLETPMRHGTVLTWSAPLNDGGSPLSGYTIYRGDSRGELQPLVSVPSDRTSFLDDSCSARLELAPGPLPIPTSVTPHECFYAVAAGNAAGESMLSNEASSVGTSVQGVP